MMLGRDAPVLKGAHEAHIPLETGILALLAHDGGDTLMPVIQQIIDRQGAGPHVVQGHRVEIGRHAGDIVDEHDRQMLQAADFFQPRAFLHRGDDHPIHLGLVQDVYQLFLFVRVLVGVAQHNGIPMLPQHRVHALDDVGEKCLA